MLSKWQIVRLRNLQPAAPRRHVVPPCDIKRESDEGCYASFSNESVKVLIKSEAPSRKEENPQTVYGTAIRQPHGIRDGQEGNYACFSNNESVKVFMKSEAPSKEEENPQTVQGAAIRGPHRIRDGQLKENFMQENKQREKKKTPKKKCQKQVFDSEDCWNPADIPRNGDFFQHDLRCTDGWTPRRKKQHFGIRKRWKHDKFQEEDQAPKSKEELIATYGYDIRAEENTPTKCPSSPTKQRNHPKIEVQKDKQKRPLSSQDISRIVNNKLCDLRNHQTSSKNTYFGPGGYEDEQPENEDCDSSSTPKCWEMFKVFQARGIKQPRKSLVGEENRELAVNREGGQKWSTRYYVPRQSSKESGSQRRDRTGAGCH